MELLRPNVLLKDSNTSEAGGQGGSIKVAEVLTVPEIKYFDILVWIASLCCRCCRLYGTGKAQIPESCGFSFCNNRLVSRTCNWWSENGYVLWDMKHVSYSNLFLMDREWSKIAENIDETWKYFVKYYYWLASAQPDYTEGNEKQIRICQCYYSYLYVWTDSVWKNIKTVVYTMQCWNWIMYAPKGRSKKIYKICFLQSQLSCFCLMMVHVPSGCSCSYEFMCSSSVKPSKSLVTLYSNVIAVTSFTIFLHLSLLPFIRDKILGL